ncbi:alkaline phosphatase family protein [Candidatus Woesearchaeota archaeon]|nr:alkaline phosphatase family protein [Candidatus Woesearchaeota archaeon]
MGFSDLFYQPIAKRLKLAKKKPTGKGLLIIQIDSVPHSLLKRFIEKGSCKFIASLLKKGYHLHKYNCGIPSGTPAVQAGIMYGDNSMIPGFRFFDKQKKKFYSFGNPNHVREIEQTHFSKTKGILHDGSSYSNHFSGSASRSILTLSTVTKTKRFKRLSEGSLWFFLFLRPISLLRVIYYSLAELIIEFVEMILHPLIILFMKRRAIFSFKIPFRRLLMNSILTEIITIGTILDIKRKVPRILVNYLNFDEIGHLRGPNSTGAGFALRSLDRRVRRICKYIDDDEYDVYILSDHGQVDSIPFRIIHRMNLVDYIQKCADVKSFGLTGPHEGTITLMATVLRKIIRFLQYVSAPLRLAGTLLAKAMLKVVKRPSSKFNLEKKSIVVADSCSMAHVYFSDSKKRMGIKDIEKNYPDLIEKLINTKGIGLIMAKQGNETVLFSKKGKTKIENAANILKKYGDEQILIKQLKEFNTLKNMGDLVIFGDYKDGVAVSFAEHVGAHGGIGGDMTWPFIISKKKLNLKDVRNANEMHKVFKEYI